MTEMTLFFLDMMVFTLWMAGICYAAGRGAFAIIAYLVGSFALGAVVGVFV